MTEITKYICDMCGKVQEANTGHGRQFSDYYRIFRDGMPITDETPQALCPDCGPIVFIFIKSKSKNT